MNKNSINYSFEDRVEYKLNNIILNLFKSLYPDRVEKIKNLIKQNLLKE
jgi:hypothetical protein